MVRFLVLGQFAIELDGAAIDPPAGRRARSLLAWLLLHPGLHPRSRLAARFWPDVLDTSARASLRVALSELRAALASAAACLIGDRNHAGIATERVWVDALAFEQLANDGELEAAVALCRGSCSPISTMTGYWRRAMSTPPRWSTSSPGWRPSGKPPAI